MAEHLALQSNNLIIKEHKFHELNLNEKILFSNSLLYNQLFYNHLI